MNVLVRGLGTIGTTLAHLLCHFRSVLGINRIFVSKHQLLPWQEEDLRRIVEAGATACVDAADRRGSFPSLESIVPDVQYVFDCREAGLPVHDLPWYQAQSQLIGASAQGTEKAFGIPSMLGVNDEKILGQRFVAIASCNTHGTASVLQALAGQKLEELINADVVVVRRCEDLAHHERLVTATVVSRHLDPLLGTHHAVDIRDLFQSIGVSCPITSSDATTPSQLLHAARFSITLRAPLTLEEVQDRFLHVPYVAVTAKFDSNLVFELGRRYGFQGRIYAHGIIVTSNLLIQGATIKGWMFVPQEGNTLLSTLAAFLYQTKHPQAREVVGKIVEEMVRKRW